MPSRFAFYSPLHEIEEKYRVSTKKIENFPYYNLKPTNKATGLINKDGIEIVRLRWGFLKGSQLFKVRAETIHEKKTFKDAFHKSRCLIFANGFFEWENEGSKSIPYYFTVKKEPIFTIAGIYHEESDKDTKEVKYRFAVVTTEANNLVKKIFHRMPVIISYNNYEKWLDPEQTQEGLLSMLKQYNSEDMDSWQVNPLPSRGDNGPNTIKPVLKKGQSKTSPTKSGLSKFL
ncbi:MAG: SOS response-associated peptidase [Candidatus Thorarchaeota archaeon]